MSTRLVSNIILTDTTVTDFLKSMSIQDFYALKPVLLQRSFITPFLLGSQYERYNEIALCNNNAYDTYVPLSPSSISWYWPEGGDARRLGR